VESPEKLTYVPTPPSDRAKVVRNDDGFVLTIPPRLSWRFALSAALGIGIGIALIGRAVWPGPGYPAMLRLIYMAVGVFCCYVMVDQFTRRHDWAVITLASGTLTVTTPHLFRHRIQSLTLADYSDASLAAPELAGCLALIKKTGGEEVLLEDVLHRPADLRFAEAILRDAIKRMDPQYSREQDSLETALAELRSALPDPAVENPPL